MELTPEERARIYAEEKARLEIRRGLEKKKTGMGSILAVIALSIILVFSVLWVIGLGLEGTSKETSASEVLSGPALCAASISDIAAVLSAYKDHDLDAMAGLLRRGKALQLKAGTKLHVLTHDQGMASVLIESGGNSGESCWIYGALLQ
jgi:hypothetical protein